MPESFTMRTTRSCGIDYVGIQTLPHPCSTEHSDSANMQNEIFPCNQKGFSEGGVEKESFANTVCAGIPRIG